MATWFFLIVTTLFISVLVKTILSLISTNKLPPGPVAIPIISSLLWLRQSPYEMELALRKLHGQYGPIFTLNLGSRPKIFVGSSSLAHQALVQSGAVFADRPPALATDKIITSNQHNISSAPYGLTWRLLRRNLTSEILHPMRVKSYGAARKWVLDILTTRLQLEEQSQSKGVIVVDHFQYAMFCLLVLMCFGDKLDEKQIKEVERVQRQLLLGLWRFRLLSIKPNITKIVLKKQWSEFLKIRKEQEDVLIPLIRARSKAKEERLSKVDQSDEFVLSYVDTLWDLQLHEEKRKLEEGEIVSLCSEFLSAGTDTTSTALQWIMANIVKYPHVQERIFAEIKGVVKKTEEDVKEDDLQKMPYLKAVILEGLRRHPPGHFLLPHRVTQDIVLDGYVVPKNATVNFTVADIGWDSKVWEDPMAFKPERFLSGGAGEGVDITGNREIKMMPFGAGRRICPASGLAMLHLEYFVANLVWRFEWKAVDGANVDLSEKQEFTVVMKNPLQVNISQRVNK
ncbi:cytochrome P450 89A2-like [Rosa rugosa]|uniref:cytochrome P450 89A2-like n=1 Tax=Rosa rugosa TaxID=74645 RepID=UPI002B41433D|nr:cytochrome P450 89A2-like [Rosa rugosa]